MNEGIHLDLDTWIVPGQSVRQTSAGGWKTDTHPTAIPGGAECHNCFSAYASTKPHTYAYGGAAQGPPGGRFVRIPTVLLRQPHQLF